MSETAIADVNEKQPPRLVRAFKALRDRRMAAMLLLSFAAGIPYGVVLGTLNAWFAEVKVDVSQAGVLSFIILAYSFKFMWAPGFQKASHPIKTPFGARRSWLLTFQFLIAILIGVLSLTNPLSSLGLVAIAALAIALLSATHDIVLDAWRIEVARSDEDLDLMSALYQFGYRIAGLLTGALALVAAARLGWSVTIAMLGGLMLLSMVGTFVAPEPKKQQTKEAGRLARESQIVEKIRQWAASGVLFAWGIAILILLTYMWSYLTFTPPSPEQVEAGALSSPMSTRTFMLSRAPIIVGLTVLLPALVAAFMLSQKASASTSTEPQSFITKTSDAVFGSVIVPLVDLVSRLGWAFILVLALILTYRFADLVWGSFAYFFYLDDRFGALWMTNDEVAVASKTFGVIMTVAGSGLGAIALIFLGRMPCLFIGALIAAATNLLFADLAAGRYIAETATFVPNEGGDAVTAFMAMTRLDHLLNLIPPIFGLENRPELTRLMGAIAGENLAVGFASVASVAFLTSIVNPKYAAVQY
ncbi:MAG: beta-lactamase induction signal transducer, partial [Pseudomonadota bacterium]